MKKILLIANCLLLMLLTACFALPVEEEVLPPPVANMPEARPMRTAPVVREDVILFTNVRAGYIPARQETIHFNVAGQRIRGVFVSAGDEVYEGDILAELDRPYLFTQLEDAAREEEWALLDLSQLETRLNMALSHAERSRVPVDDSSFLNDRRRILGRLAIIRRRLEYLQREIDGLFLRAPFDGVVTWALSVTAPTWSYIGQEVVTVADLQRNIFTLPSGPAAAVIRPGMNFEVVIDGEAFPVVAIDPEYYEIPAAERVNAEAFLLVTDGDLPLVTSHTVAMVHVVLDSAYNVIAVPNMAVNTLEGRSFVYVLVDDVVVIRDVEIGLEGNTLTEIRYGLQEGEVVVI